MKKRFICLLIVCSVLFCSAYADEEDGIFFVGKSYDEVEFFLKDYSVSQTENDEGIQIQGTTHNSQRRLSMGVANNHVYYINIFVAGKEHVNINNPLSPDWLLLQDMVKQLEDKKIAYQFNQIVGFLSPVETFLDFSGWIGRKSVLCTYTYSGEILTNVEYAVSDTTARDNRNIISLLQQELGQPQRFQFYREMEDDPEFPGYTERITWKNNDKQIVLEFYTDEQHDESLELIDIEHINFLMINIRPIK